MNLVQYGVAELTRKTIKGCNRAVCVVFPIAAEEDARALAVLLVRAYRSFQKDKDRESTFVPFATPLPSITEVGGLSVTFQAPFQLGMNLKQIDDCVSVLAEYFFPTVKDEAAVRELQRFWTRVVAEPRRRVQANHSEGGNLAATVKARVRSAIKEKKKPALPAGCVHDESTPLPALHVK